MLQCSQTQQKQLLDVLVFRLNMVYKIFVNAAQSNHAVRHLWIILHIYINILYWHIIPVMDFILYILIFIYLFMSYKTYLQSFNASKCCLWTAISEIWNWNVIVIVLVLQWCWWELLKLYNELYSELWNIWNVADRSWFLLQFLNTKHLWIRKITKKNVQNWWKLVLATPLLIGSCGWWLYRSSSKHFQAIVCIIGLNRLITESL